MVLAGAIVTYGGVSLFVAFFVLAPMAQALFRAAAIPRRLMPAAIALGTSTFTMSALPGTPAIQNAIPMPFFGTTPFAAPGLGIIASAMMLGFGLWWLGRAEAAARRAGEPLRRAASPPQMDNVADDQACASAPPPRASSIRPRSRTARTATTAPPVGLAALPLIVVVLVNLVMSFVVLPRLDFVVSRRGALGRDVAPGRRRRVGGGDRARRRDRDGDRDQLVAAAVAASDAWTPAPTPRCCRR